MLFRRRNKAVANGLSQRAPVNVVTPRPTNPDIAPIVSTSMPVPVPTPGRKEPPAKDCRLIGAGGIPVWDDMHLHFRRGRYLTGRMLPRRQSDQTTLKPPSPGAKPADLGYALG